MGPRCSLIGQDQLKEFRAPSFHSLWFSFPGHPPPHLFLRLFNLSSYTRCVLRAWNELSVQEQALLEGTVFHGTLAANPTQALDSSIFPSGSSRCEASISDPGQCQDRFTVQSQARGPGGYSPSDHLEPLGASSPFPLSHCSSVSATLGLRGP